MKKEHSDVEIKSTFQLFALICDPLPQSTINGTISNAKVFICGESSFFHSGSFALLWCSHEDLENQRCQSKGGERYQRSRVNVLEIKSSKIILSTLGVQANFSKFRSRATCECRYALNFITSLRLMSVGRTNENKTVRAHKWQ